MQESTAHGGEQRQFYLEPDCSALEFLGLGKDTRKPAITFTKNCLIVRLVF